VVGGRRLARLTATAGALALLSGCGITHLQDLQFRVDDRLHFVTPADRSLVHLPVTLSWTMQDFRIAAPGSEPPSRGAGYFAVFVDHTPIKPGHTMKDVASGDSYCMASSHCPDRAYLLQHQIYTTTRTTLKIRQIAMLANDSSTNQRHTITVVLMDTAGHRLGESSWELDVRLPKVSV
jgi:hypothetical protein